MTPIGRRFHLRRLFAVMAGTGILATCQPSPPPTVTSPVQSNMYRHFALARDLRSFAVTGDLDSLRVTARALSTVQETWGMPPGSDRYLERLRAEATGATEAPDLERAAVGVAQVARECGACHLANNATLGDRFQVAQPLVDDPATRHVNYLSWASRLLWNGLLGPSDRLWDIGARALADPDEVPAPHADYVPASEVERSRRRLSELGAQAVTVVDPSARADLLGRIWAECGGCHVQAGLKR